MLRSFVSICITLISGLLVFAVLRPTQASYIYNQLRTVSHDTKTGVIQSTVTSTDVLGESEQPIVSKSGLLSFFDKKYSSTSQSSGNLAIQSVIDATNNERVKAKLLPFEVNSKLAASAKIKVEDMITRQYFEHEAPTGEGIAELGKKVGYNYIIIGENLALGNFASADDLLLAWMNSPGHRANILNDKYQELGIYVAEGLYKDKKVWFAVQHFGTARVTCPAINSSLKKEISITNAELKTRESEITALRAKLEAENQPQGDAYNAMIAEFNAKVKSYNQLLTIYQKQITQYNTQVISFNACLKVYQVKNT